jgi:hypothetical protein
MPYRDAKFAGRRKSGKMPFIYDCDIFELSNGIG